MIKERAIYFFKLFYQSIIIYLIYLFGIFISDYFELVIPGSIIGMLILLFSLKVSIIKLKWIEQVSTLLLDNMMVFFIPSAVSIIVSYSLFAEKLFEILSVIILSTVITFVSSALTTEFSINPSKDGSDNQ
jgi:holin-like protein